MHINGRSWYSLIGNTPVERDEVNAVVAGMAVTCGVRANVEEQEIGGFLVGSCAVGAASADEAVAEVEADIDVVVGRVVVTVVDVVVVVAVVAPAAVAAVEIEEAASGLTAYLIFDAALLRGPL